MGNPTATPLTPPYLPHGYDHQANDSPFSLVPLVYAGLCQYLRVSSATVGQIAFPRQVFVKEMAPPSGNPALNLQILPGPYFVVQLRPEQELPPCVLKDIQYNPGSFFSITRTWDEISLVGELKKGSPDMFKEHSTWICIRLVGPMDHTMVGVVADITGPLRMAKVPIFAMSTWSTDHVLVPKDMLLEAVNALERDGWVFTSMKNSRRDARL